MLTVELPTDAPLAALSVRVTPLPSCAGKLTVAGWKVMVTPLGRDEADSENVPETVPTAAKFIVAESFTSGATIRGCLTFIVSVPEEPVGDEVDALADVLVGVVVPIDVEDDDETMGIVM
jgi:hypothetical protein